MVGHGLNLIVMPVRIESEPAKSDESQDCDKPFCESSPAFRQDRGNDEGCKHDKAWNHSDGHIGPPRPIAIKTKKRDKQGPTDHS